MNGQSSDDETLQEVIRSNYFEKSSQEIELIDSKNLKRKKKTKNGNYKF